MRRTGFRHTMFSLLMLHALPEQAWVGFSRFIDSVYFKGYVIGTGIARSFGFLAFGASLWVRVFE